MFDETAVKFALHYLILVYVNFLKSTDLTGIKSSKLLFHYPNIALQGIMRRKQPEQCIKRGEDEYDRVLTESTFKWMKI